METLGNGFHWIILDSWVHVTGGDRESTRTNWCNTTLTELVKNVTHPVNVGATFDTGSTFGAGGRRAFSLYLLDVQHLSVTQGMRFMNTNAHRMQNGTSSNFLLLRTPFRAK